MNTHRLAHLVLALATATALSACGQDSTPTDQEDAGTEQSASAAPDSTSGSLTLTADGSTTAKCAVPSAEVLAGFDTAFAGTVTSLDEGAATLSVDEWYAGDEADTVTVESPSKDLADLLMAVDFQEGKTYLVSATGERVTLCGFTAEESPELQALYDEAFGQ